MNPPKPTALKIIEGNPGKRNLPKHELKPSLGLGECPQWVSDAARPHWPELSRQLKLMGIATCADTIAAGLLVDAIADYIAAKKELSEQGSTFTTEKGYVAVHPSVAIRDNSWKRIQSMLMQFGQTPSSRTRVAVVDAGTEDAFDSFVGKEKRA